MFITFFEGCAQEKARITTSEAERLGVGCMVMTLASCLLQQDSCLVLGGKGAELLVYRNREIILVHVTE